MAGDSNEELSEIQDRYIETRKAIERLDSADILICNEDWEESLSGFMMTGVDGKISDTGAFGLTVSIDNRFDRPVVIRFDGCVKEL